MYVMQYALSLRQDLIWNDFTHAGMRIESENISDLINDLIQYNLYPQDWKLYHLRIIKRETKTTEYLEGSFVDKPCLYVLQVMTNDRGWVDAQERSTNITAKDFSTLMNRVLHIPARLDYTREYRVIQRITEIVETVLG